MAGWHSPVVVVVVVWLRVGVEVCRELELGVAAPEQASDGMYGGRL